MGAPWAAGADRRTRPWSSAAACPSPPHRSEGIGNGGGGTLAVQVAAGAPSQKRGDGESDDDDADDGHPDEQDGGDGRPEEREPHPGERRPHIAAMVHERDAVEQGGRSCAGRRREQRDDAEQRHEDEREAQRDAQRHALRLHAVQNGAANGDEEEGHDVAAPPKTTWSDSKGSRSRWPRRSRGRDEQHNAQNDEADAHDVAARAVVQDAGLGSTARLRAAADLRVPLFDRFPEAFWALAFSLLVLVLRATVPLDLQQVHDDHGTLLGALPEKREQRVAGGLARSSFTPPSLERHLRRALATVFSASWAR